MPWGKHKGKPLPEIPERYLTFMLRKGIGKTEHRRVMLDELQRRFTKYRSERWESLIAEKESFKVDY